MIRRYRRGRHSFKGACSRNSYAVLWAPRLQQWVRLVCFGEDDCVMLDLNNTVLAGE